MSQNKNLFVIYLKDGNEEIAEKVASKLKSAIGIAKIKDDDGHFKWGVLINKQESIENR